MPNLNKFERTIIFYYIQLRVVTIDYRYIVDNLLIYRFWYIGNIILLRHKYIIKELVVVYFSHFYFILYYLFF